MKREAQAPYTVGPDSSRPAFPQLDGITFELDAHGDPVAVPLVQGGMSTRTWLTGQALSGVVERLNPNGDFASAEIVARLSVRYADAVLRELGEE